MIWNERQRLAIELGGAIEVLRGQREIRNRHGERWPIRPPRVSGLKARLRFFNARHQLRRKGADAKEILGFQDRKSTRLNSSHVEISYAVFCLKKKKKSKECNKTIQKK